MTPMLTRALQHRNFRLFFGGQGISFIGTWITRIATSWLVYRLTGSLLLLGIVGSAARLHIGRRDANLPHTPGPQSSSFFLHVIGSSPPLFPIVGTLQCPVFASRVRGESSERYTLAL